MRAGSFSDVSSVVTWWFGSRTTARSRDIEQASTEDSYANPGCAADHPRQDPQDSRRIYVLGVGNVGTFIAHSLAGIPNRPPITLLLEGFNHYKNWEAANESLSVTTRDLTDTVTGFDIQLPPKTHVGAPQLQMHVDVPKITRSFAALFADQKGELQGKRTGEPVADSGSHFALPSEDSRQRSERSPLENDQTDEEKNEGETLPNNEDSIIHHLIVTTKSYAAAKAVSNIKHRLTKNSTILFLQKGLGILEEVNESCFPDPDQRPTYMLGVISHGLKRKGRYFNVERVKEGTVALGIMPQAFLHPGKGPQPLSTTSESSQFLLRTMTRTPVLVAVGVPPSTLYQLQLDELAIDSVIQPITALLDTRNGAFNETFHLTRVLRLLLAETCHVFRNLPELRNVPNVNSRYDPERIERRIWSLTGAKASIESSMLHDLRFVSNTEIDYVTGYIIRRGEELGMHCLMNYMLLNLVKAKSVLHSRERNATLPFAPFAGH